MKRQICFMAFALIASMTVAAHPRDATTEKDVGLANLLGNHETAATDFTIESIDFINYEVSSFESDVCIGNVPSIVYVAIVEEKITRKALVGTWKRVGHGRICDRCGSHTTIKNSHFRIAGFVSTRYLS